MFPGLPAHVHSWLSFDSDYFQSCFSLFVAAFSSFCIFLNVWKCVITWKVDPLRILKLFTFMVFQTMFTLELWFRLFSIGVESFYRCFLFAFCLQLQKCFQFFSNSFNYLSVFVHSFWYFALGLCLNIVSAVGYYGFFYFFIHIFCPWLCTCQFDFCFHSLASNFFKRLCSFSEYLCQSILNCVWLFSSIIFLESLPTVAKVQSFTGSTFNYLDLC